MRVLLVEDNQDDALLIQDALSETAIAIERTELLSTALEKLARGGFDAVLLDLSLPDAYGLATLGRMRRDGPSVPIVVLSGLNSEEVAVKAVEEGAQDYLIKGHTDGALLTRALRYAIQRHRAEENLKERNRELLVLRRISENILGSLDLKLVLEQILEQAMLSGSFDLGNIRLLDASGKTLEVAVVRGYRDPQNVLRHRALSRTTESEKSRFGDRVFNQPCVEEAVQATKGLRTLKREGAESLIEVPVRSEGEVLGILQLASRTPRKFKNEEVNLLETIGNQVGIAVQRAQLHEETRRQAHELEKANQLQADFTAMIAHDLRSPLMNIMGVAEVMMGGTFGGVTEEQKKWLLRLRASGQSLVDLVSDFLDVSKLESGYVDVNREVVDLAELIQKSIESFRVLALDKNISIKGTVDPALPSIHADPRRLDQVLSNLISNAIKFTGEGGEVEVVAQVADATKVNVRVRDTGEGIPADEIGQIFEKYRQGGNVKQSSDKGTGLGLVICKMIVEAHGGCIWVESEVGKGSTVFISLPVIGDNRSYATPA
ncbi:MAG TPA: ATP-binding protein [Candidatus Binatia bacterium]|jgi:signal transduction histidine kinase